MGETTEKTVSAKKAEKKNKASLKTVFKNLKIEFNKIIWPTQDELIKQTAATVIVSVILGAIIFGLDKLIVWILFNVMGL